MYLFLNYPKCSTCRKAKKWLETHEIPFVNRHMLEERPTEAELTRWVTEHHIPIKKLFNTSGVKYKELHLKDQLPTMTEKEQIALLASDGMLVKRPLLISEEKCFIGFKEEEWEKELL